MNFLHQALRIFVAQISMPIIILGTLLATVHTTALHAEGKLPLTVPEGFTIERVAKSPVIKHPTMACFDDRGRLFVCENAGVNLNAKELEKQLPNSIRMLEDRDGDGKFEHFTLFADKMTFPMGAVWHDGALYVASPPKIWKLEDTTGDGKADKRTVLVDKFGFSGNAASIHGCFAGPDGRIYWVHGRNGHDFKDGTGEQSKKAGAYILSCTPNGSDIRIHCGGGMDNPVELDFTDEGEILGTVNIMYSRPRKDCLVHWQYGGTYPYSEYVLGEFIRTGELLKPIHHFGHVAISGTCRLRSNSFGKTMQDNFFATQFNTGKIVRVKLDRKGGSFKATEREFLTSKDRNFKPTDILEDADGSLLVIDTGGWFYSGCPTSQFANPDIKGGIYRIRKTDTAVPKDPWGKQIAWNQLSNTQLIRLMADDRIMVQRRALYETDKRGDAIVADLGKILSSDEKRFLKNRSLWALCRIDTAPAKLLIRKTLLNSNVSLAQTASRVVATNPDPLAYDSLLVLLKSDSISIRRQAAEALGRIGNPDAVGDLLDALGKETDRALNHALIFALIELNQPEKTRSGFASKNAAIQRATLIALDQMEGERLSVSMVAPFLDADDQSLRLAALDIFLKHPQWNHEVAVVLEKWITTPVQFKNRKKVAHELVAQFAKEAEVASVIGNVFQDKTTTIEMRQSLMRSLAACQKVPLHKSWLKPLIEQLQSKDIKQIELAIDTVASIKTGKFDKTLTQISQDEKFPLLLRVAAMEATLGRRKKMTEPAFQLLTGLLKGDATVTESSRAAQLLGASLLNEKQLIALAPLLEKAGPMQLHELIRPYLGNQSKPVATAFLNAMENAPGLLNLQPPEFSDIIKRYPKELRKQANGLLDKIVEHDAQKVARLDRLIPLLEKGVAKRGREVFYSKKSKCSVCHRIGSEGGKIGPDLTTIGLNRSSKDLLESIVFPSASLVRQYEPFTIVTQKGRVYSGLIQRETPDTIYIQQQVGDPIAISRNDILKMSSSTTSIMPAGLEKELSEQDLADVIAWLKSLKTASSQGSKKQ